MNQSDPSQNDEGGAKVIVLLPVEDDPVAQIASGDFPHVTLAYFGDEFTDVTEAKALVDDIAKSDYGFSDPCDYVDSEGILGDNDAEVYFLDAQFSGDVHEVLMVDQWLQGEMSKTYQYPEWTPHITVGYPEAPQHEGQRPDEVIYDRIALFYDGEVYEQFFDFTEDKRGVSAKHKDHRKTGRVMTRTALPPRVGSTFLTREELTHVAEAQAFTDLEFFEQYFNDRFVGSLNALTQNQADAVAQDMVKHFIGFSEAEVLEAVERQNSGKEPLNMTWDEFIDIRTEEAFLFDVDIYRNRKGVEYFWKHR